MKDFPFLWALALIFGLSVLSVGAKLSYYALTIPQFPLFFDIADGILIMIAGAVFSVKGSLKVWECTESRPARQVHFPYLLGKLL